MPKTQSEVQKVEYRERNGDILRAKERNKGRQKFSAAKETIASEQARLRMKTLAKRKLINVPECQDNYCATPFGYSSAEGKALNRFLRKMQFDFPFISTHSLALICQREDISRMTPGKPDFIILKGNSGVKENVQKRYLTFKY